ncbi:NAD(P)/FAD-dependent oxidoreductase [Flagellimonas myxillae]|uniref:NAD(P)/FAD-dependent oxidoreductase n=1 Tax=Flagellimonas myxillae TaxID=2942214 RepID=UPI00201ED360|nr:NAD(P)/FAD-dependent oxidoreductase [Muricauda myxillae]MCL6265880.1 NAD(P)/FAD-dependent oxidoreductase [Muricauda myxillae]
MKNTEVLIIGGGLAGLTAALDLVSNAKQVVVVEKKPYPRHKVCGEYISNEVKPYLEHLGMDFEPWSLPQINNLQLSTQIGKSISVSLPLGGFGMSRYALEEQLYRLAMEKGVEFIFTSVVDVDFQENQFEVSLLPEDKILAKMVLGAFGKRSNLETKFSSKNKDQKSPWLAVKSHFIYDGHPENLVALHNFSGGYAGISQVEDGLVNLCYLARYDSFKPVGDIDEFNHRTLCKNPYLNEFFNKAKPRFEKPLSIAQISFGKKTLVSKHMLRCGDSAGMIHPLCGNGMAMAIHGAKIASKYVVGFLDQANMSRELMEKAYQNEWNAKFGRRIWWGGKLQNLMMHTKWFNWGMQTVTKSKTIMEAMIKRTHGEPILN